jgi:hypothetical protein
LLASLRKDATFQANIAKIEAASPTFAPVITSPLVLQERAPFSVTMV